MKRYLVSNVAVVLVFAAFASPLAAAQDKSNYDIKAANAIKAVIDAQAAAWNRGDLAGYMDGYDRSSNTEFMGGDTITRGWHTGLDRYRLNYNSRDKMGALAFAVLQTR